MSGSGWLVVLAVLVSLVGLVLRSNRFPGRPGVFDSGRPRGNAFRGALYAFGLSHRCSPGSTLRASPREAGL